MHQNTKKIVYLGLLSALAIALAYLIRFPIFPAVSYLEYDMADVPILIGTFMFGPWWGLVLTVVVSVLQGITVSAGSGWVGIVMHICATGVYVLVAAFIFRIKRNTVTALFGVILGTIAMAAAMVPLNLIFTVHFNGVPAEVVQGMLVPFIIPFNLIKAGANGIIALTLFKTLGILFRQNAKN